MDMENQDKVKRVVLCNNRDGFKRPYSHLYSWGNSFNKHNRYHYQPRWKGNWSNHNNFHYRRRRHNNNSFYHDRPYNNNSKNSYNGSRGTDWKSNAYAMNLNRSNNAIQENVVSTSSPSTPSSDKYEGKVERKTIFNDQNYDDHDEEDDMDDASTTISENEVKDLLGISSTSSSVKHESIESSDDESSYKTEDDETWEPQQTKTTSSSSTASCSTFQKSDSIPKKTSENYSGFMDIDLDETSSQISVASESILTSLYKSKNIDHQLYDEMTVLVRDQLRREVEKISTSKSNKTTFASLEHVDIRQKVRGLMDECFRQKMVIMLSKDPEEQLGNIFNQTLRLKLHEVMESEKDLKITPPDIGIKYELKCLMIDNFKETTRIIFLELKEDELKELEPSSNHILQTSLKQEFVELKIIESRIKKIYTRRIEFINKQIEKGVHVLRHKLMEVIDSFMFTTITSTLSSMISRILRLTNRNLKNTSKSNPTKLSTTSPVVSHSF